MNSAEYITVPKSVYESLVKLLGSHALFTATPDNQEGVILDKPFSQDLIVFIPETGNE